MTQFVLVFRVDREIFCNQCQISCCIYQHTQPLFLSISFHFFSVSLSLPPLSLSLSFLLSLPSSLHQLECAKEGVDDLDISYTDNTPVIDLFLARPIGLLCLLDEQCKGLNVSYQPYNASR